MCSVAHKMKIFKAAQISVCVSTMDQFTMCDVKRVPGRDKPH